MEWWVLFIIFWAVFGCGRGCRRGLRRRRHEIRGDGSAHRIPARAHGQSVEPARGQSREPVHALKADEPRTRETPFEKLRREFVEGVIDVDEYERGLDRMDPKHLP